MPSGEIGPSLKIFLFFNDLTTGAMISISSLPILPLSPACGLSPDIINFGFIILKSIFKVLFNFLFDYIEIFCLKLFRIFFILICVVNGN